MKNFSSVSTEMAAAPLPAYTRAMAGRSTSGASSPREGEARLSSAISRTRRGASDRGSAGKNGRGAGAVLRPLALLGFVQPGDLSALVRQYFGEHYSAAHLWL